MGDGGEGPVPVLAKDISREGPANRPPANVQFCLPDPRVHDNGTDNRAKLWPKFANIAQRRTPGCRSAWNIYVGVGPL